MTAKVRPTSDPTIMHAAAEDDAVWLADELRPHVALDFEAIAWLAMGRWQDSERPLHEFAEAFGRAMCLLVCETAGRFADSLATERLTRARVLEHLHEHSE